MLLHQLFWKSTEFGSLIPRTQWTPVPAACMVAVNFITIYIVKGLQNPFPSFSMNIAAINTLGIVQLHSDKRCIVEQKIGLATQAVDPALYRDAALNNVRTVTE